MAWFVKGGYDPPFVSRVIVERPLSFVPGRNSGIKRTRGEKRIITALDEHSAWRFNRDGKVLPGELGASEGGPVLVFLPDANSAMFQAKRVTTQRSGIMNSALHGLSTTSASFAPFTVARSVRRMWAEDAGFAR